MFEIDQLKYLQTKDYLEKNQIAKDLEKIKNIIRELEEEYLKKESERKTLIFFDNIERLGPFA
jgi:replication-associated recombination protein RarA